MVNNIYNNLKNSHKISSEVIVDLGANAGIESLKLLKCFDKSVCISVEPIIENVFKICSSIIENKLQSRWFVEHCAISEKNDRLSVKYELSPSMEERPNASLDSFNWEKWNYKNDRIVKVKTLTDIEKNPSILKIDIERHEYVVLPSIVKNESIKIIFLELHAPCYDLDIVDFFKKILENTHLEITRCYKGQQAQKTNVLDNYIEIPLPKNMKCGDYCYVVLEKKND